MKIKELHKETWNRLQSRRSKMPHALLVTGLRGLGQFELARYFVESLLCENLGDSGDPCGACMACNWLAQGNHPDFRFLQPEAFVDNEAESGENTGGGDSAGKKKPSQQITIDQIRGLEDFLHVGTHRHGLKVVLINPAEAMNRPTANSLLKTLEEPAPNTLFILVSGEPTRLLPTIRSRCQALPVSFPDRSLAEDWLARQGVSDAGYWFELAGGAPFLAAELAKGEERALLDTLIAELARGLSLEPLVAAASLDRLIKSDKRPAPLRRMIEWVQKWLVDLSLSIEGVPVRYFVAREREIQALSAFCALPEVIAFSRKAIQYRLECEQPLNSRLFLENFFLNYARLFRTHREGNG